MREGVKISQDLSQDFHMGPKREKDLLKTYKIANNTFKGKIRVVFKISQ